MAVFFLALICADASAIISWETPPLGYKWAPHSGTIFITPSGALINADGAVDSVDLAAFCPQIAPGSFFKGVKISADGFAMGGTCRSEQVLQDGTVQWAEYPTPQYFRVGICKMDNNGGGARYYSGLIGTLACTHWRFENEPDKEKNLGPPSCDLTGGTNPINIASGNKFQSELDYNGAGLFPLRFERSYNSDQTSTTSLILGGIGLESAMANWRHSYSSRLALASDGLNVQLFRPDGKVVRFSLQSGAYISDADVQDKLAKSLAGDGSVSGWQLWNAADNVTEEFDETGRLLRRSDNHGNFQNLSYADGHGGVVYGATPSKTGYLAPSCLPPADGSTVPAGALQCVTNSAGRALQFTYDAHKRLVQMVDPAGRSYSYAYGEEGAANLTSVRYPDGGTRQYWYNEPNLTSGANLPFALTGISDENGARYATWRYDKAGRAISSEHGAGADRFSVRYSSTTQSTVTDANAVEKNSTLQVVQGVSMNAGQSQPGGAGCSAASLSKTYDANGNVATQVDFRGVATTYTYDMSRNLETRRVEADGTAASRTVTTQWHASLRLPVVIAEPKRLTAYEYDEVGNMIKKTQRNTLDESGAKGLQAQPAGDAKVWTFTYNAQSQLLSSRAPRTDLAAVHEYTYDNQGNLTAVKNPLGQSIALSNYTPDGLAGRLTDLNGVSTDYVYDERGRLLSTTTGGRTTSYTYDAAGNRTAIIPAGEAALALRYDDAHRLVQIIAADGASVTYTLDGYGNRTGETVLDAKGSLTRQITRAFDALNRLQQITGGAQ